MGSTITFYRPYPSAALANYSYLSLHPPRGAVQPQALHHARLPGALLGPRDDAGSRSYGWTWQSLSQCPSVDAGLPHTSHGMADACR
jgi:hypothetical protein